MVDQQENDSRTHENINGKFEKEKNYCYLPLDQAKSSNYKVKSYDGKGLYLFFF